MAIFLRPVSVFASNVLQLRLSDSISIYSEKAYRRQNGTYFEAVGNVIISAGKDSLYGEKATINTKTGLMIIEGSVRFIGKNITLYGSKIEYDMKTELLDMQNARMITPEFSIVAARIVKKSERIYHATDAEFTTCKDCTESWQISGKTIKVEIGQYIQVHHALLKAKGIDVLYLPYLALPIKITRESGLLFPKTYTRDNEGLFYEQPLFWALNDSRDMTITPKFFSERGYGVDLQYREVFGEDRWLEVNSNSLVDQIYQPEALNSSVSGEKFFRTYYEIESHYQFSNDVNQHISIDGIKDLDYFRFLAYGSNRVKSGSDLGVDYFIDKRFDLFSIGLETQYKRNLLDPDPLGFDEKYVQTLPSLNFNLMPYMLWQRDSDYFYKMVIGFDSDYTMFKQNRADESRYLRNVGRLDSSTYLDVNLLNLGPLLLKTKYQLEYQAYNFLNEDESNFYKQSGLLSTEFSFVIDRVFGLAYNETYSADEIKPQDREKIFTQKQNRLKSPISQNIVGVLPVINLSVTKETINVEKFSYRHSQEYKFIHHKLIHTGEAGNQGFKNQISTEEGWFDYRDAILENLLELASNETRTKIPLNNTLEFQWNNVLIRKSDNKENYLIDNRYLKDNFSYKRLGYFNISQGLLLDKTGNQDGIEFNDRLTRLHLSTGYSARVWSVALNDYFIHKSSDNILQLSGQRRFEKISLLSTYNYNSFSNSSLKTVKAGAQYRPVDIFGLSFLKEYDLDAERNIASIYQVDFMPNNNCWIINFNYRDNFVSQRFAFNFEFNFGNEKFKAYKRNFFSFSRLSQ